MSQSRARYDIGESPEIMTATLGELRNELSIGLLSNGVRQRTFELHDFRSSHDFEIADLREKNKSQSAPAAANEVLAVLVKSIGSTSFERMDIEQRKAFLGMMSLGDVQQMYLVLRRLSMGAGFDIAYECPGCSTEDKPHKLRPQFNLDKIEILTLEETAEKPLPAQVAWYVPLRDGLTIKRGEKVVQSSGIWMRPIPWAAIVELGGLPTASARKRELLRYAVLDTEPSIAVGGAPVAITDAELNSMSKYDLARLEYVYENESPGPQLVLSPPPCDRCKLVVKQPLNWSFDSFFGYSTPLPARKKKFSTSSSS